MYQVQAHFPPIPPMDLSVHLQLAWEGIWFSTMNSAAGGPGRHTLLNVSLGETGPPTLAGVGCRCCGLGLWPVSCQKQAHIAYLQLWRFSSLLLAESSTSFISLWMWAAARNVVLRVGEGIISWFFPFSTCTFLLTYEFAFVWLQSPFFWGDGEPTWMFIIWQTQDDTCASASISKWEAVTMAVRRSTSKSVTKELNPATLIQFLAWQNLSEDKENFNWSRMSGSNNEHGCSSWNMCAWMCSRVYCRGVSDIWQH